MVEAMVRVHAPSATSYSNVKGLAERGYMRMPRIADLSPGAASLWKAPALPLKPCQTTSWLNGKAYVSVGKAGGAFHTMLVLQAYQADLLMDLNLGERLSPGAILDLSSVIDLALRTIN